jgi:hypothetical protein
VNKYTSACVKYRGSSVREVTVVAALYCTLY